MRTVRSGRLSVWFGALLLLGAGCASKRLLRIENRLLHEENASLTERVQQLERVSPGPDRFVPDVSLDAIHGLMERGGMNHAYPAGATHIRLEHDGQNTDFSITIQFFDSAKIVFLATKNYLRLTDAKDTESVVLLLVQLAAINYDMLLGKLQMNPKTGEVLLSTEIHVADGLGFDTLRNAYDNLIDIADTKYPELERAISGVGL